MLDRRTLQRTASGSVEASVGGISNLGTILDAYSGSLDQLVVLNWVGVVGGEELEADRAAISNLLQKIGAPPLTAAQRELIGVDRVGDTYSPGSAVGVAGAPAGSAFLGSAISRLARARASLKTTAECRGLCGSTP